MKRALSTTLLVVVSAATLMESGIRGTAQDAVALPSIPFEDVGACPFEGCVYREWMARETVTIWTNRHRNAPVAFRLQRGERVTALTGIVITMKPGRVQFREPTTLASAQGAVYVRPGQTLYLLTYQGEGFTKAWFNGRLHTDVDGSDFFNAACDDQPSRCTGRIIQKPKTEWWVQIRNRSGKEGWTRQPDKFDGSQT